MTRAVPIAGGTWTCIPLAALTAVLAGCSGPRAGSGAAASPPQDASATANDFVLPPDARGVAVAPVAAVTLSDYLDIPARIQADPRRLVRVYAPVSGRILSVEVRPADTVYQGQVLATIASSEVAAARAAYRQAEADLEVKQQNLERARLLWENDAIAKRDVQQAEADGRMAAATLESARERLALLNVDTLSSSDEIAVEAPRAGVMLDLGAAPGEFSKSLDNSSPLCTIADLSTVWAVGDVFEKDLATVAVGDPVQVVLMAYPDEAWRGRIDALGGAVDSASRAVKLRVVLGNPRRRLKPDLFATIRVARSRAPAVVVPQAAVLREGTSAYAFVQTAPGHFEQRTIVLGRDLDDARVQVTAGLVPGDTVVVEGAGLLRVAAPARS